MLGLGNLPESLIEGMLQCFPALQKLAKIPK